MTDQLRELISNVNNIDDHRICEDAMETILEDLKAKKVRG